MDPVKQFYGWLADHLRNEWHEYRPPSSVRFRASEAGNCSRQIWYRLMGFKPDEPRGTFVELITKDGDLLHDVVRYWFKRAGVELYDLTFKDDGTITEDNSRTVHIERNGEKFDVAFRADGGVIIESKRHVLEIKTIDGFSYSWMEKAYKSGGWPRLLEYMQEDGRSGADGKPNRGDKYRKFFSQATVTGLLSDPPAEGMYIVIKNRSLGQIGFDESSEGMALPLDENLLDDILNRFASIAKDVREGIPPMQEYTKDSKSCQFCQFRERCWGKDSDGKK